MLSIVVLLTLGTTVVLLEYGKPSQLLTSRDGQICHSDTDTDSIDLIWGRFGLHSQSGAGKKVVSTGPTLRVEVPINLSPSGMCYIVYT